MNKKLGMFISAIVIGLSLVGCGSKSVTTVSTRPVVVQTSPTTDKIIISKITQGEDVNGTTKIMYTATNNNKVTVFVDAQLIITNKNGALSNTEWEVMGDIKPKETKTVTDYIDTMSKGSTYKFQMEDFNHQDDNTWMN